MLAPFNVSPKRDQACLLALADSMRRHGYNEAAVEELYGHPLGYRDISLFPAYFWRLGSANSPAAQMALIWLQRIPQPRQELAHLLGETVVAGLLEMGILSSLDTGLLRSNCDLQPRGDQLIFTDPRFSEGPDKVYHLGGDSYLLPALASYARPRRLLDLCTGSGVQAIANGQANQLDLVDINPRALLFCQLNLMLNGLYDKARVHRGNLWQPVEDQVFDWISANPPFIPDPPQSDLLLFQGGGGSGEEITQVILEGAEKHLETGGTLAVVTNAPARRGERQTAKLRGWLGLKSRWGVMQMVRQRVPRDSYIAALVDRNRLFAENPPLTAEQLYADQFIRHLKHYEAQNIDSMLEVIYLIKKLPLDSQEWSLELDLGSSLGQSDHNAIMASWQSALTITHSSQWAQDWQFELLPNVICASSRLMLDHPVAGLRWHEASIFQEALVEQLKSARSGQELVEWTDSVAQLQRGLMSLACWGALRVSAADS